MNLEEATAKILRLTNENSILRNEVLRYKTAIDMQNAQIEQLKEINTRWAKGKSSSIKPAQLEKIISFYETGIPATKIASTLNLSYRQVLRAIKKYKID